MPTPTSTITIPGGLLIAVEGIDGAGKTTLARAMANRLTARGVSCYQSKEPTNLQYGAQLRATAATGRLSPQEELRLLVLDRREHIEEWVKPRLRAGEVCILDRYYFSTLAYQGAKGIALNEIERLHAFAPEPDLLLVLDLDPKEGLRRITARGDLPNAFETSENLRQCRAIFQSIHRDYLRVIDATQNADAVLGEAMRHVLAAAADKARRKLGMTTTSGETVLAFAGAAASA